MSDAPFGKDRSSAGIGGDGPDIDELRDLLIRVGSARPAVEPDVEAIVGRAGQRIFRRRIGTGLALLGLVVPAAVLTSTVQDGDPLPTTTVTAVAAGSESDCQSPVDQFRFGYPCRYL